MDDNYSKLLQLRQALPQEQLLREKLMVLNKKPKTNMDVYNELAAKDPELAAIAMIESSGGQNTAHALDTKSGMTAGGMFGMMPGSASDVVRLDQGLANKYPEIVEYSKDLPNQHAKITEFFNDNPEAAAEFAKSKFERNKAKLGGDLDATSFSWFQGLSRAMRHKKNSPGEITNHDYVKKFKQYYKPTKVAKD